MGRPKLHPEVKRANRRRWEVANADRIRELGRKFRKANRVRLNAEKLAAARVAKEEGIVEYGGRCACCGEYRREFLTIEHAFGRGASCYRKIEGNARVSGLRLWLLLKWKGWPRAGYVLLCFNCNCAKGAFGYCPHERERKGVIRHVG